MKSIRIAGLCLVAMFVVSIVGTGSASAASPEFVQCRFVGAGNGHWKDSQCKEKEAGGSWDTRAGGSQGDETFSSVSGEGKLKGSNNLTVKCTSDTNEGTITGPSHVLLRVKFHGCETEGIIKEKCTSPGLGVGQIETVLLKGWLFYINEAKQEVGLWLKANSGKVFAEFKCGTTSVTVFSVEKVASGSCIAGRVKPVNEFKVEGGTLAFKEAAGLQEIEEFEYEGKKIKCRLESENSIFGLEKNIEITEDTIAFQFDTMIKG